jgi:hypothetical protein
MITKPGIYKIPESEYHADPCPEPSLSNSIAKVIESQSPFHAWLKHPRLNPEYREFHKTEFDMGSAAHNLLLEPKNSKVAVLEFDSFRTKLAQQARDEAYSNGLIPVLEHKYVPVVKMRDVALKFIENSELAGIFDDGKAEQAVIWQEENGVWCRALIDFLPNDHKIILDYKTTTNANPDEWSRRQIISLRYDMQAEFYKRGVLSVTGVHPEFVFLVQENTAPYSCSLVGLDENMQRYGKVKILDALDIWSGCVKMDKWESYPKNIMYYNAPTYAMLETADREELRDDTVN